MQTNLYESYSELLVACFEDTPAEIESVISSLGCEKTNRTFETRSVPLDFRFAYVDSPRLGFQPSQILLWEPTLNPKRTAMISNDRGGYQGLIRLVAQKIQGISVFGAFREKKGSFYFDYYRTCGSDFLVRSVATGKEDNGRWHLWTEGDEQPFEEPEHYQQRRVRDRLSRDLVTRYFLRLGFDLANDNFWRSKSDAILIWNTQYGRRKRPGREGVDPNGTAFGWESA